MSEPWQHYYQSQRLKLSYWTWGDANKPPLILVHGGPVAMPEDAAFILQNTRNCHGFYGASSMERLPTEVALTEQTRKFKSIAFKS